MCEAVVAELVLEIDNVTYPAEPPFDAGLPGCSFSIRRGGLVVVRTEKSVVHSPLVAVALGLMAPQSGTVRIGGRDWQSLTPDEAASWRGHIGRVFAEDGWVSNLDVDENLVLAQLHHTHRPREALWAEAAELASRFGIKEIPHIRVHLARRSELRILEWVRALLGDKALLALEYPLNNVAPAMFEPLMREIRRVRDTGTGVLWITRDEHEFAEAAKEADAAFELKDHDWVQIGGR
jgi:ABC-type sugar transport system ATPase subunit